MLIVGKWYYNQLKETGIVKEESPKYEKVGILDLIPNKVIDFKEIDPNELFKETPKSCKG